MSSVRYRLERATRTTTGDDMSTWHQIETGTTCYAHATKWRSISDSQGAPSLLTHDSEHECLLHCRKTGDTPIPPSKPSDPANRDLSAEQRAAIATCKKLVEFWSITSEELQLTALDVPVRVIAPPKYKHPKTDDVWDGEGAQPDWLKVALTKEGYTVQELRDAAVAMVH